MMQPSGSASSRRRREQKSDDSRLQLLPAAGGEFLSRSLLIVSHVEHWDTTYDQHIRDVATYSEAYTDPRTGALNFPPKILELILAFMPQKRRTTNVSAVSTW
jgi:hypothetical protein